MIRVNIPVIVFLIASTITAWAADIVFDGHLYTSLRGDGREGTGATDTSPKGGVTGDGTPRYMWRYEADIGINANINEDTFARLAVTLDDRKKPPLYRYALAQTTGGDYALVEDKRVTEVYASLEDISLTKLDAFGLGNLTVGGFDVRYGDGGYYNDFINDIDSNCFVAYLDPYGGRLSRGFGPLSTGVAGGIGEGGEAIIATKETILGFDIFFATEGRSYDLRSLWDQHYANAMPGYWRGFYRQTEILNADVVTEVGSFGDTLHFGIDRAGAFSIIDYYFVFSYHRYKDSTDLDPTAATGGSLIQLYPDIGVRIVKSRLWARGALIYQLWSSNNANTWGAGKNKNSDLLLWGEPQFFIRDDIFVGCGFTFQHPSISTPADIPIGAADTEQPMNVVVTPHLMYSPAEFTKIDLTFDYRLWHGSYDLGDTDIEENAEKVLTLDIEVIF
jgi:hypothetical protein